MREIFDKDFDRPAFSRAVAASIDLGEQEMPLPCLRRLGDLRAAKFVYAHAIRGAERLYPSGMARAWGVYAALTATNSPDAKPATNNDRDSLAIAVIQSLVANGEISAVEGDDLIARVDSGAVAGSWVLILLRPRFSVAIDAAEAAWRVCACGCRPAGPSGQKTAHGPAGTVGKPE